MFYLIYIIIFILLGIYFIIYMSQPNTSSIIEGYINSADEKKGFSCPDILLQKGIRYFLYNSKLAMVPGVNPIEFQNLEDYTEFMEWQRSKGIRCPVLFLQYSYNAQGDAIYKGRPTNLQGGLSPAPPSTNVSPSYLNEIQHSDIQTEKQTQEQSINDLSSSSVLSNMNREESEQNEGLLHSDSNINTGLSANAMDDNWGGVGFTQKLVDEGVYDENNVFIAVA